MKLGLFIHDFRSRKQRKHLYGVAFHDSTYPDLCCYTGQVFVYDANAKLVQELATTIGQGLTEWSGYFYYFEDLLADTPLTEKIAPPFLLTNLPNIRLAYRGPVAVDTLGKKFRRQDSDAVWLGVTGPGWFGALRMKRSGWILRKDHWELYAYTNESEANPKLPGPVFQPDGIEGPDAVFLRVTELLAK